MAWHGACQLPSPATRRRCTRSPRRGVVFSAAVAQLRLGLGATEPTTLRLLASSQRAIVDPILENASDLGLDSSLCGPCERPKPVGPMPTSKSSFSVVCRSWATLPRYGRYLMWLMLASTLLRTYCTVPFCPARAQEMNGLPLSPAPLPPPRGACSVVCARGLVCDPSADPEPKNRAPIRQATTPCPMWPNWGTRFPDQAAGSSARGTPPGRTPSMRLRQGIAISLHNIEHQRWDFEKIVSKHVRWEKASSA